MINLRRYQNAGQTLLFISLRDRLTQLEHQVFLPAIQSELEHYQNLCLLVELDDHLLWDPRSHWRKLKFDPRHKVNIHKLAIVGGGPHWQNWLWSACQALKITEALPFSSSQRSSALLWLQTFTPQERNFFKNG